MAARELEELNWENLPKKMRFAKISCVRERTWIRIPKPSPAPGEQGKRATRPMVSSSQRIVYFQVPFADQLLSTRGQFSLEILLVQGKRAG